MKDEWYGQRRPQGRTQMKQWPNRRAPEHYGMRCALTDRLSPEKEGHHNTSALTPLPVRPTNTLDNSPALITGAAAADDDLPLFNCESSACSVPL